MEYIYGMTFEHVMMSILIGVALATILYEKKGVLSGGIIVPAILSLFLTKIIFVLSTLVLVLFLNLIVTELRKRVILYGRRLFSIVLIMGVSIVVLSRLFVEMLHYIGFRLYIYDTYNLVSTPLGELQIPLLTEYGLGMHYYGYVIGIMLIPIVVNDAQIQGMKKTFFYMLSISIMTFIIVGFINFISW